MELASFFSPEHIVQSGGLLAIGLIIFAECGLLIGIFFPGDTLLLAAGVFAAGGKLPLGWLLLTVVISTILGYEVGYRIGERLGPRIFKRDEGILFKKGYIDKTRSFFERYGKVTLIFARFIANVRTIVSLMAGAGKMDKRIYFIFNVIGGFLWAVGVTMLGYAAGSVVPNLDKIIVPLLIVGLVLLYTVILWGVLRNAERRHHFWTALKSDMRYLFSHKK